ncbi:hypothetical protein [Brevibacterium casei]|uniref:hypothetical protein n=1 Tax=Brevibacterium casei TaxID=33889 RepID=UPI00223B0AF8|nr:hypothetical protein [Brevibacterium casei]MCT1551785.1 hypothetical protein [Brevibacterium casei]MCT1561361.1 hypothetical protein [Brevibacterium casei]MCT2209549.1 hypothetical protein [Brevibacterium casei]
MTGLDVHELGTPSRNRLDAHFLPDGTYVFREHFAGDVPASDAITLAYQGDPLLATDQWAEVHRLLTARAPSYAAANHEGRKQIIALTRLDLESALARNEEEEEHFRRDIETGDASPY